MRKIQKTDLLHNQVYNIIKEQIMNGDILPGERIIETRIAEQLGVSRGTIREAFQMLLKDGLLIRNDKIISIYKPDKKEISDVYECRISIESLAAKLATQRISSNEIVQLEKVISDSKQALKDNNKKNLTILNQAFHDIIQTASNNEQLIKICDTIKTKILFIRTRILKEHLSDFSDFVEDHEKIFIAIKNQDANLAEKEMRIHIESSFKTILDAIESK
ncbi:GntR family transcriptional regulator [Psychrobacillus sp. OK032]|uniref:GntR family transcriptional regulator n=1 Tax=Psychrobacillus sp. OK032 TaxID=1884358 RepID=UPI0008AB003B|nr:GntR family transcriptional regulator [Psychrobacillus sp. OK032]SES25963.1 transcriptional regulator, GntR family [Psychrobacillus sp. OK032]